MTKVFGAVPGTALEVAATARLLTRQQACIWMGAAERRAAGMASVWTRLEVECCTDWNSGGDDCRHEWGSTMLEIATRDD